LKLKKLLLIEITSVITILALVMFLVEVSPILASSGESSHIDMYNEKVFTAGNLTLSLGEYANTQFNYSTYIPAILVLKLYFQNWITSGALSVYCNGRLIATIFASPNNPSVRLTTISTSGSDWVKPPSANSVTYENEVSFVSEPQNGYEGSFSFQISIRGST
jgi:hypothetical protein